MTIDEAIKLQGELKSLLPEVGFNKYIASTQLGIEALKRCKNFRDNSQTWGYMSLQGETEE